MTELSVQTTRIFVLNQLGATFLASQLEKRATGRFKYLMLSKGHFAGKRLLSKNILAGAVEACFS